MGAEIPKGFLFEYLFAPIVGKQVKNICWLGRRMLAGVCDFSVDGLTILWELPKFLLKGIEILYTGFIRVSNSSPEISWGGPTT